MLDAPGPTRMHTQSIAFISKGSNRDSRLVSGRTDSVLRRPVLTCSSWPLATPGFRRLPRLLFGPRKTCEQPAAPLDPGAWTPAAKATWRPRRCRRAHASRRRPRRRVVRIHPQGTEITPEARLQQARHRAQRCTRRNDTGTAAHRRRAPITNDGEMPTSPTRPALRW